MKALRGVGVFVQWHQWAVLSILEETGLSLEVHISSHQPQMHSAGPLAAHGCYDKELFLRRLAAFTGHNSAFTGSQTTSANMQPQNRPANTNTAQPVTASGEGNILYDRMQWKWRLNFYKQENCQDGGQFIRSNESELRHQNPGHYIWE